MKNEDVTKQQQYILCEDQETRFHIVVCGCRLLNCNLLSFISVSQNLLSPMLVSLLPPSTADDAVWKNQNETGKV